MVMKFFNRLSEKFKKKKVSPVSDEAREIFRRQYAAFQKLLAANNSVLEVMADMEEKLSGEFLFDMPYINRNIASMSEGVGEIILRINEISDNKYIVLNERFDFIKSGIEGQLVRKIEIPEDEYVISLDEAGREMTERLGGKNAHLGEVKTRLQMPVPEGFAVSAYAFRRFMEHNGFMQKIKEMLSELSMNNMEELTAVSSNIREMVVGGEIPDDLRDAIGRGLARLREKCGGDMLRVSVRSSALQEDGEFSFAGQYSTFLNVSEDSVPEKYKEVVASLFNERAVFYFRSKGFQDYDMVMSVGVLKMVNARAGGVAYSRDPNKPGSDDMLISAVHGLGVCVVDGTITPETYIVSRHPELNVTGKHIPEQKTMYFCRLDGGVEEIPVSSDIAMNPCLADSQILALAGYALAMEEHYGRPQDIEWAVDEKDNIFILQTRPLRIMEKEAKKPIPTHVPGYDVLIDRGVVACKGIGTGRVHIVLTDDDLKDFPDNAVLVARHTSPKYVTVMNRASAIITDFGGSTGHMASLAREFQVPAILDTETGTKTLQAGQEITVDAFNCTVYSGKVDELIALSGKREDPFRDTMIFKTLKNVLKWVSTLNLHDPDSDDFRPENCGTFHDITRFCHEMAMNEMFHIQGASVDEIGDTRRLVSGIPLVAYIIDLDGGLTADSPQTLSPDHVLSHPFKAFYRGLSAMKWPHGSPTVDAKGFLGMLAHTASIPEYELKKTGEKSFSFISREYMNFTLRLGYHLSTVEAYAGPDLNNNYIRFFFKGGGAALERRLRRVRLITRILKSLDFDFRITEDVVDASVARYRPDKIEQKLEALGKLTVYTKQLDMVMFNDSITDHYIEEFIKKHVPKD